MRTVRACSQGVHLADCRHAILTDRLDFERSCWAGISNEAKDFVQQLLQRELGERPTAREALQHPWLLGGTVEERNQGTPLSLSAVQRIQVTCLPSLLDQPSDVAASNRWHSQGPLVQLVAASPAQPAPWQAVLPCANHGGMPFSLDAVAAQEVWPPELASVCKILKHGTQPPAVL